MVVTNADITIYNSKYGKYTRLDKWCRTVIKGVHFHVDNKVTLTEGGLKSADVFKIRISVDAQCDNAYLPEHEYKALTDTSGYWTLQNDDVLVYGVSDREITCPAELKDTGQRYCKITSWADNRFGGQPHWRIGGV